MCLVFSKHFDCAIWQLLNQKLSQRMQSIVDMLKPWSYGKNRCYRTMKRIFGENVPLVRQGVHHNGLDDAITQAVHLQEIFACVTRR